jgi:T5SS/PEP-CTERM-associated repeat protein
MRAVFFIRALIFGFVFITTSEVTFAQPFVVTLEAPKVQQSSLFTNSTGFGATNVIVEPFDELKASFISKPVPFAGNAALGSYDHLLVRTADAFGGAGGKGTYMTVNTAINAGSQPTTLTLATPQRYFGLWWSAGDPNNLLSFYSGSKLIETFRTNDVVNFINAQPNKSAFYGNPNNGQNKGEPYAFLNFYADPSNPSLTFNRIVFSNVGSSGFEQDNHTIATIYTDISGKDINPATSVDLGGTGKSTDTKGVEGSSSTLTDSGTAVIGGSGTGTLNVIDGGKVTDGGTAIGQNPGSTGTVDVSGSGSSVADKGTAVIGAGGSGTLDVVNGGKVNDAATEIGQNPGSSGNVVVDGKTSSLSDTGSATIGDRGAGTLDITNGGAVNDTNATLGAQSGSSGIAMVDGAGSQWNNSGTLDVGPAGSGVIDIMNGGTVTADRSTIVGPDGKITGDGTITTPTLINNGTVAPAGPNSTTGTLTIDGNYQQGSKGILDTEIGGPQSSQADQLKVTGTAALSGTLALTSLNNFHPSPGATYEILAAAGGVTGNFTNFVDTLNTTGLTRTVVVTPNGVVITYLRPPQPTPPSAVTSGPPAAPSLNLSTSQSLPTTPLTNAQKNSLLVPVVDPSVEQYTSLFEIWFSNANTQRFNIENRFDNVQAGPSGFVSNVSYPKPPPTGKEVLEGKQVTSGKGTTETTSALQPAPGNRWGVWTTGFGDFVNVDDDGQAKGYDFTTGGLTVGIDYRLTEHFVVGIMGGYAHTWSDLKPTGSLDVDSGWGGIYAGYFNHGFYVDGSVFGGHQTFESERGSLLGVSANASSGGDVFSGFVAAGYDFHVGHLTIGPHSFVPVQL